jgi:DNA mismatch repair protein MutL
MIFLLFKSVYNKIQILPDFIANQIAAGEVVQRPESIVKELVENSIDAGADQIAVFIKDAGKQLIHVVDNGCGISKEDLPLALKRHATSKIYSQDDLEEIKSLGFRGEALASISSVANLEIKSRHKDAKIGYRIFSEPNKEFRIEPTTSDIGTQILVRNLFFNIPARRKFLKSNLTEVRHISETMLRFALAKPNIKLIFYDNDNIIFEYKPSDKATRIKEVFGIDEFDNLLELNHEDDKLKVNGFIGRPSQSRSNRNNQYLFLNGRYIVNKSINHAIFSCYEHLLDKNYHPIFILDLTIDYKSVDVNVHPQKHEVKFEDERLIYNFIKSAISKTLNENNITSSFELTGTYASAPFQANTSFINGNYINRETGEIVHHKGYNSYSKSSNINNSFSGVSTINNSIFDTLFSAETDESLGNIDDNYSSKAKEDKVWLMHNKYIFFQNENGLMIVDMHNAHERVLYERAINAMNNVFKIAQNLLFPLEISLSPTQKALVNEISKELNELGFTFNYNESLSYITLISVPSDIKAGLEEDTFKEILDSYLDFQELRHTDKRDNLAATFACKAAVKTGQKISKLEMLNLIDSLLQCKIPYVCPHGRPVVLDMSLTDFDKQFGRTS